MKGKESIYSKGARIYKHGKFWETLLSYIRINLIARTQTFLSLETWNIGLKYSEETCVRQGGRTCKIKTGFQTKIND
jgi:hypothetical protein